MLAEPEPPLPAEETPEELEATEAPPDPERLLDEEDPPGAAPADPLALAPDLDPAEPPPRAWKQISNNELLEQQCDQNRGLGPQKITSQEWKNNKKLKPYLFLSLQLL